MVPEWILDVVDWLAYQLVCRSRGHKPGPGNGPVGTKARMCDRCLRLQVTNGKERSRWTP